MSEHKCPCCGQAVQPDILPTVLKAVRVSPNERRVLDHLIEIYPRTTSARALAEVVYAGDPSGGPDGAEGCIAVFVSHLRKKVGPHGWTVGGGRGWSGSYGLVRVEAQAA